MLLGRDRSSTSGGRCSEGRQKIRQKAERTDRTRRKLTYQFLSLIPCPEGFKLLQKASDQRWRRCW